MIVFTLLSSLPDYTDPPPSLLGIFESREAAIASLTYRDFPLTVAEYDNSAELRAYHPIEKYDTATGRRIEN